MAPKPVFILLRKHLSACLMSGTSITESGITVSTDKLSGEIIHFFRIDSDAGRKQLDMIGLRCCDCLIFYTKETEQEEMLCCMRHQAPQGYLKHVKELKDTLKGNVQFKVVAKHYKELGAFLRG